MRLGEKLRLLDRTGARFRPKGWEEPGREPRPLRGAGLPEGALRQTAHGAVFVREVSVPLELRHGRVPLAELLAIRSEGLALLAHEPGLSALRPEEALFLDVETTGLMSGAGLLVFLVGVGFLRGDRFVVEQYFLRDPAEEPAFLEALLDRWRGHRVVVTYNGRQFDQPRLRDRLRFHQLDSRLPHTHHLDLFLLARRVWRERFSSLSLQDLEARLLDHHRRDDLPGALCPVAYANYLRGDAGMIGDVFRHNLEDILSLAALAVRLDRVARGPRGPFEEAAVATGLDHLGRPDEALPLYEMSFSRLPTGKVHRGVGRRLANIHRRSGKLERSVEIWRRLWKDGDLRSARNLAIALEHRLGDLRGAERVTRAALEALERGGDATSWSQEDWERRLIRVRRKRERTTRNGAARGGSHHA